jgi:hypothetical protein
MPVKPPSSSAPQGNKTPDPFIEKCIKFTFRVANDDEASQIANGHFLILKAIHDSFADECKIFNNQNERLTAFKLPSHIAYLRHFTMHHRQSNTKRKRKATYSIFHRFQTSASLSTIRKQQQVRDLLNTFNGNLSFHAWTEDTVDIVSLGFFTQVDPVNFRSDDYEKEVISELIQGNGKGGIPKFKVIMTSPSTLLPNNTRLRTKSYDLQVQRGDARVMTEVLQKAYMTNPKFVFYRMRYVDEKAFNNAIRAQNRFLADSMTVPLIGIPHECMFYLEHRILAIPGVSRILRHRYTESQGRFNIQTTAAHFKSVTAILRQSIASMINDTADKVVDLRDPDYFPQPGVMLREDNDSDTGSVSSYFSSCSDAFSLYEASAPTEIDLPPSGSKPATQAWGKPLTKPIIVSDVTTNTFSTSSSLSSPMEVELRQLKDANLLLAENNAMFLRELTALRQQFSDLQRSDATPTFPPPIVLTNSDIPSNLETTIARLIAEALSKHHPHPNPTTPERSSHRSKRQDQRSSPHSTPHTQPLDSPMQDTPGPSEEDQASL